jgi:hypothetical protein
MAKVKSALEIALEKAGNIATFTQEEKARLLDEERLLSVLREFYQGNIDSGGLWQHLKGSKPFLLREAQLSVINTFGLGSSPEDFRTRTQAILAVETLKDKQNTAMIESELHSLEALLKEYQEMKDRAVEDLKQQIEMHPQMRMRPVRTPDGKTVMQMTVSADEAVKARLSEFLSEQEGQFNQEFSFVIENLKNLVM